MKNITLSVQIMYNAKGGDSFELNSKLHSDLLLRSGATITALNMILSKSNSDTLTDGPMWCTIHLKAVPIYQLTSIQNCLTLEAFKKVIRLLDRGKGSIGPLSSTFDKIHPLDMIFDTYNEITLYFQLNVTTWCITDFHDNGTVTEMTSLVKCEFWYWKWWEISIYNCVNDVMTS